MKVYENRCCNCAVPGYPCKGDACELRKVPMFLCDGCGCIIDEPVDGIEYCYCEDCLERLGMNDEE